MAAIYALGDLRVLAKRMIRAAPAPYASAITTARSAGNSYSGMVRVTVGGNGVLRVRTMVPTQGRYRGGGGQGGADGGVDSTAAAAMGLTDMIRIEYLLKAQEETEELYGV